MYIYNIYIYRRLRFFRGENIFVYKRKVENYFYEILLLNEILVKYVSKYYLKIYYMKINYIKKSTVYVYIYIYIYIRIYIYIYIYIYISYSG